MLGDHLDLASESPRNPAAQQPRPGGRRYIGVNFACCDVYQRVYVNHDETAYVGHCPRCAKQVRFRVGPGGTDARVFIAS